MKQIISLLFASVCIFQINAQDIYIQYDNQLMDKLEYKFVEPNATTTAIYSSYRLTHEPGAFTFLQAGIENVKLVDNVSISPVNVRSVHFDANTIEQINSGTRKLFLCREFKNEWALLHIGSVERIDATQNNIFAFGPDFDFNINPIGQQVGDNLSTRYANVENTKASVFYLGQTQACNTTAYHIKKSPSQTCLEEQELLILPALGIIRNQTPDGKIFELTEVNGKDVCSYLGASTPIVQSNGNSGVIVNGVPEGNDNVVINPAVVDDLPVVQDNNGTSNNFYNTDPNSGNVAGNTPSNNPCGNWSAQDDEHIVKKGENLLSIARQHGVTLAEIKKWNNLSNDVIQPCSTLKIAAQESDITSPDNVQDASIASNDDIIVRKKSNADIQEPTTAEVTTSACDNIAAADEHVVQKGESLYGIARQYGLSAKQLLVWNKLSSSKIFPCSVLKVAAQQKVAAVPLSYNTKVVVKSLAPTRKKITKKSIPQFAGKSIKVREGVIVNSKSISARKGTGLHVVQKNETVSTLAKRFELTESNFRDLNGLSKNEKLEVGQVVRIQKNCSCDVAATTTARVAPVAPDSYATISVRSKSVGTENHSISADNSEMTSNVPSTGHKYHVVAENETLYSISKKFGVSIEKLMELNRLQPNEVIIPNQTLVLE